MNCFLESFAGAWISVLGILRIQSVADHDSVFIHDNLEMCRISLEKREIEMTETCQKQGREALERKQKGDLLGAKIKLQDRKRTIKRLEKLRNSLNLIDAQIDALKTTELDKEVMSTLLASTAALKKAGIKNGVRDAENVISDLDEQMRESAELTSILSGPLLVGGGNDTMSGSMLDLEATSSDLEAELAELGIMDLEKEERMLGIGMGLPGGVVGTLMTTSNHMMVTRDDAAIPSPGKVVSDTAVVGTRRGQQEEGVPAVSGQGGEEGGVLAS